MKKKLFIASGEDPQSTPKSRKGNEMMYGHPMTPGQANVSPGGAGMPHNEDFEMGSPPWPRTPASPVFNSHAAPPVSTQDSFRSSKVTVMSKSLLSSTIVLFNLETTFFLIFITL